MDDSRIPETGSLQEVTQALVDLYLASAEIEDERVLATTLYKRFMIFIRAQGYKKVSPSLHNVGRALASRLTYSRTKQGTVYYLIKA